MEKVVTFTYPDDPLPADKSSIRVLRIDRANKSSITGRLERLPLDAKDRKSFVTISYFWGESNPESWPKITINDSSFPVTPNVVPILELLRDHEELKDVESVWIDGICINQHDSAEKNAQVKMMGRIYSQSARTIAWLGPGEEETDEALDMLAELMFAKRALAKRHKSHGTRQPPEHLRHEGAWKPLRRFFTLPWWRRVWTLQEFILAPRLDFYWGDRSIGRSELKGAVYAIWLSRPSSELIREELWSPAWNRRRLHQWYKVRHKVGDQSLLAWISYHSNANLSDPRDRIYGVLGLVNETDKQLVGSPNYDDENRVTGLYHRFTRSWIQTHGSLDIICFSQLFHSSCSSPQDDRQHDLLPSWVPDWRDTRDTFVTPLLVSQSGSKAIGNFRPIKHKDPDYATVTYAATGECEPRITILENPMHLACEGVLVDVIDGLGGVPNVRSLLQSACPANTGLLNLRGSSANVRDRSGLLLQYRMPDVKLLDDIVRCIALDRKDRYLGTPAPVRQYRDELLVLASRDRRNSESQLHRAFSEWFRENKRLLINGRTIEELCRTITAPEARDGAGEGEMSFASRLRDTTDADKMGRRLATTNQGYIGMVPPRARSGDAVCVLLGCSVPVVLRRMNDEEGTWEFVGECYLQGFMDGEALKNVATAGNFILS